MILRRQVVSQFADALCRQEQDIIDVLDFLTMDVEVKLFMERFPSGREFIAGVWMPQMLELKLRSYVRNGPQ